MPQKSSIKCIQCDKTENVHHHLSDGTHLCVDCYTQNVFDIKTEQPDEGENNSANNDEKKTRKSTRTTRFKNRSTTTVTTNHSKAVPKGKGRRVKKVPYKTPTNTATITTVDSLFYDKSYIQVGDIVSVIDKNEAVYYAQIRGLMVDSYCQKAAFLTWLIPTKSSPPPAEKFDPSSYLIGPEEDFPRKLSCMRFIMHAPSNYYFDKNTPYPPPDVYCSDTHEQNSNFIWSNVHSLTV